MGKQVTRLFEQFQPEHYELLLAPDREKMTFQGRVTIRGKKVGRPSQRLTFHQKGLKITSASAIKHDKNGDHPVNITRVNNQNSLDEVRLHSEAKVFPGEYTVTMEFTGQITRPMNGIYPCYFKHEGQDKKLIATQFESNHAHEAFPCIDEPEAKATFDLSLITPADEPVVSNTPIQHQGAVTDELASWLQTKPAGNNQLTTFETTPRMSAYLLAFVYGEMSYLAGKTKNGVAVRTFATPANAKLMEHGLQVAIRGLEFFEEYFGVPYPLTKLDLVALPDFSVGAMENWGLMTFREQTMLVDPKTGSIESKQLVAIVVCHELSHQWFGNLVTMKWWDDLWLNESFANLMEYVGVNGLYPQWQIWEQFVSQDVASAKRRDSLLDVQTIKTAVNHPDEIEVLFDPSIVYAKGGTILRMLMTYVGEDAFRRGLKLYFDKHQYGNTEANDLWAALSQASGQPVADFMDGWLTRPGYPLIDVDWQPGEKTVNLQQQRFISNPSLQAPPSPPWQVPLVASAKLSEPLLKTRASQLTLQPIKDQPAIFNHEGSSYYLPYYRNHAHLQSIVQAIHDDKVSTIDRLLLLDNYTLLQRGGQAATTDLLDLLKGYERESSENVWGAMSVAFGEARRLVEGDEAREAILNQLIAGLATPLATKLGWDDAASDSAQTLRLRGLVSALTAGAKVQATLDEGLRRFRACQKAADLPASTRSTMFFIAARHGEPKDFAKLLDMYHNADSADEREEVAGGMSSTKRPKDIGTLLSMFTSDDIRRQDLMHWYIWMLRNRYSREATWQWLVDNWDWAEREMSSDKTFSYFARYAGSVFSKPEELEKFKAFFEPKKTFIVLAHDVKLAVEEITARIAWRERNEAAVKAWLTKQAD